jgi:uncharacterized damage-inducible protein DinB
VLPVAFGHHAWATAQLFDICEGLDPQDLERPVPGVYGSILDILRHLVDADDWYLWCVSDGRLGLGNVDGSALTLQEVRALAERTAAAWEGFVAAPLDADRDVAVEDEGHVYHAPLGLRLAQALHHGSDHRSQLCTGLTALGLQPPEFDLWAYGEAFGLNRAEPELT